VRHLLDTEIEFLKGVGPQRGELLRKELGIATFGDLLLHFPFRYVDRSRFNAIRDIGDEQQSVQLRGMLGNLKVMGEMPRAPSTWCGSRVCAGCSSR